MAMTWKLRAKKSATAVEDPEDDKAIDELLAEAAADVDADEEAAAGEESSSRSGRKRQKPWTRAVDVVQRKWRARSEKAQRDASQWTAGTGFATKAATGGIVLALAAGPAALAWNVFGDSEPPIQQASDGFDQPKLNRQNAAKDVALQFLPAWLGATEDSAESLKSWWPETGDLDLPDKGSTASNLSVLRATAAAPGLWNVMVGADVVGPDEDAATRRYYQVPVVVDGQENVAAKPTALPAQVPPPSRTVDKVAMQYPQQVSARSGSTTAAEGFLTALLAGSGDIRLYERPGSWIPPIKPTPADRIQITKVMASSSTASTAVAGGRPRDGQSADLLVTVRLVNQIPGDNQDEQQRERSTTSQYVLHQVARDGRWEVTAITAPPVTETSAKKPSSSSTASGR